MRPCTTFERGQFFYLIFSLHSNARLHTCPHTHIQYKTCVTHVTAQHLSPKMHIAYMDIVIVTLCDRIVKSIDFFSAANKEKKLAS